MARFRLHFESCATSPYARTVPFAIEIEAESFKDANLIGTRTDIGTWDFCRVEEIQDPERI